MTASDYAAIAYPATYADEARLHELFAEMRRDAPVVWVEPEGYPPFWALTKHADILDVERQHHRFVNEPRAVLQTLAAEAKARELTGGSANPVRSLVQMDDPDHRAYRALTHPWFLKSSLQRLAPELSRLAVELVDRMAEHGDRCDFVRDVAAWYPLRVIM